MKTYLNDNWQYYNTWSDAVFSAKGGQSVRLPHTNVETPFNCFDESVCQFVSGYSKVVHLDKLEGVYLLTFQGVAHQAEVYVNGQLVGTHACGYTAFTLDVTAHLKAGDNVLVVKVDSRETLNQPPFGYVIDYLTYGGIYREVYLENFVGPYIFDAFVIAKPHVPLEVQIELGQFAPTKVVAEVLDGENVVASWQQDAPAQHFTMTQDVNLKTWDVNCPNLYVLRLTVGKNVWQTTFGVRTAQFTKDGFYLNGKKMKLVGLNRHQSFAYVGYAMPESMQRRDARILKNKLALNVVRTSHYPQSQYFVDECDKLGLLVFTEIPGWQHIGDDIWKQQAVENVREMVTQYRNHPSVVLWGVRINESPDCDQLYLQTNAVARKLDGTRQTAGVRNFAGSHLFEDVYTYNDFNRNGATKKHAICGKNTPYLVTEYNGHMFPTKSFDDFPHKRKHVLKYAKMLDGVFSENGCGAIGWCMFDYNTHKDFGSGDRICYHGVLDMFRNPKPASSVFSAMGKTPVLDVAFCSDIGDYPEGMVGQMYCMTNAPFVDVYKDGHFVKRYTHKNSPFKNMPNPPILIDDLIGNRLTDEEGIKPKHAKLIKRVIAAISDTEAKKQFSFATKLNVLRIICGTKLSFEQLIGLYQKYVGSWGSSAGGIVLKAELNGQTLEKQVGFAKSWHLDIQPSHTVLHENTTYDVAAVNVLAVDQNGNVQPYINTVLRLKTEGPLQLIGPSEIALTGGMTGTYVKTVGKTGTATLWINDQKVQFEIV